MTPFDAPVFRREMQRLAQVLGGDCSDERMDGYWSALKDLPLDVFTRACLDGSREWRRFPVPASIREIAERVKPQVLRPAPPGYSDDSEPTYHCLTCQDTGLQPVLKETNQPVAWQDQPPDHADVKFRRCRCRETNPVIQARWASMRRLSPPAAKWGT